MAALAASVSLVGAGWLAAASLAGKAGGAADVPDPGTALFSDGTGEDPQAPDIHRVRVSNSARDDITFLIEIENRATLDKNLRVDVYLDTDQDGATGRPSDGADFALTVIGDLYPASNFVTLSQWGDGAWHEVPSTIGAIYHTDTPNGAEIKVPRADLASTAGFEFVAIAQDTLTTASDRAPDAGEWVYPLTFPATTSSTTTTTTETTSTDGSTSTTTTSPPTSTTTPTETTTTTPSPPPTSTTTTTVVAPPATTTVQQTTTVGGLTTTVQQTTTVATTRAGQSTTTPAAPVVDRCPNIRGAQPKVPRGMVKRSGKCVSALVLTASGLVMRPIAAGSRAAVRGRRDDPQPQDEEAAAVRGRLVPGRGRRQGGRGAAKVLRRPALRGLLLLDDPRLGAWRGAPGCRGGDLPGRSRSPLVEEARRVVLQREASSSLRGRRPAGEMSSPGRKLAQGHVPFAREFVGRFIRADV